MKMRAKNIFSCSIDLFAFFLFELVNAYFSKDNSLIFIL